MNLLNIDDTDEDDFLQNTLTKPHRQTFNFNIVCIC